MKIIEYACCASTAILIAGCVTTTGAQHRADVFKADQVNQTQEVKVVKIMAVSAAQIEVDNTEAKKNTQLGGAIIGAVLGASVTGNKKTVSGASAAQGAIGGGALGVAAGSMVSDKALVEGVSLTYMHEGKLLNSAQVGRACEFEIGEAIMVSGVKNETRIQPNAKCPAEGG